MTERIGSAMAGRAPHDKLPVCLLSLVFGLKQAAANFVNHFVAHFLESRHRGNDLVFDQSLASFDKVCDKVSGNGRL
jgi:hypothetical protein